MVPNNPFNQNMGWTCPRCNRVYAPHVMECWHCNQQKVHSATATGPIPTNEPPDTGTPLPEDNCTITFGDSDSNTNHVIGDDLSEILKKIRNKKVWDIDRFGPWYERSWEF